MSFDNLVSHSAASQVSPLCVVGMSNDIPLSFLGIASMRHRLVERHAFVVLRQCRKIEELLTSFHGLLVLLLAILIVVAPIDCRPEALVASAPAHHPNGARPRVAVATDDRLLLLHLNLLHGRLQRLETRGFLQAERRANVPSRWRCRSDKHLSPIATRRTCNQSNHSNVLFIRFFIM